MLGHSPTIRITRSRLAVQSGLVGSLPDSTARIIDLEAEVVKLSEANAALKADITKLGAGEDGALASASASAAITACKVWLDTLGLVYGRAAAAASAAVTTRVGTAASLKVFMLAAYDLDAASSSASAAARRPVGIQQPLSRRRRRHTPSNVRRTGSGSKRRRRSRTVRRRKPSWYDACLSGTTPGMSSGTSQGLTSDALTRTGIIKGQLGP